MSSRLKFFERSAQEREKRIRDLKSIAGVGVEPIDPEFMQIIIDHPGFKYARDTQYRQNLEALGLSGNTTDALITNAIPLSRFPLSLAGLRLFRELGIPLSGKGITPETITEIGIALDKTPLTDTETSQMRENGFKK